MLRSILAVVLGYVAMTIPTIVLVPALGLAFGMSVDDMLKAFREPEAAPPPATGYVIANLIAGIVCAALGGFVTAKIGRSNPMRHAYVLAGIVFVFGAAHAAFSLGKTPQPSWYLILLPPLGVIGILLGARFAAPSPKSA